MATQAAIAGEVIEQHANEIAGAKNRLFKIRAALKDADNYAHNVLAYVDGCLGGALALLDKLERHLAEDVERRRELEEGR